MVKKVNIFFITLSLILMSVPTASAAQSLSFYIKKTPTIGESKVSLYGQIKPAKSNIQIRIESKLIGASSNNWTRTSLGTKSKLGGSWRLEVISTALAGSAQYRAIAVIDGKTFRSPIRALEIDHSSTISNVEADALIPLAGPGGRVHGVDVSKWQHPGGKLIDFAKMYRAGVRFVMIKASDGKDSSDIDARKWLAIDMDAAQAAGLYTGFYHYAYLPNSTDEATVITEAETQAQKAIWRLASVGGYNERTLPYALDLENNCIQYSGRTCTKYASKKLVTLFATTWLKMVKEKTGRTPFLYSYSQFLENAMVRNPELRSYPLWLAHYGINPADPLGQPGQKISGCYVHSWTSANCSSEWVIWQYSSCGIGRKYGVPSGRVDLNVFRGNIENFVNLTKGSWIPEATDMMPIKEPTTIQLLASNLSTDDKPAIFELNVTRPTGLPVVTGTTKLILQDKNILLDQTAVRSKNGSFKLTVKGLPVGTWDAILRFVDQSNTHATSNVPIQISILAGEKPAPTVKPSPKPGTSTKAPADSCRGQIVN